MVFTIQITGPERIATTRLWTDVLAWKSRKRERQTTPNLHIQPRNAAFPGPASPGGGIQAVRFCIHTSPSAH